VLEIDLNLVENATLAKVEMKRSISNSIIRTTVMTRLEQLKHEDCSYAFTPSTKIVIRKIQAGALPLRCIPPVKEYAGTNVKEDYAETFAI
jgi:hypothetical protein